MKHLLVKRLFIAAGITFACSSAVFANGDVINQNGGTHNGANVIQNHGGTGAGSSIGPVSVTGAVSGTLTNTNTFAPTTTSTSSAVTGPVTVNPTFNNNPTSTSSATGIGTGGNATATGGSASIAAGAVSNHNTNNNTNSQHQTQSQGQSQSSSSTSSSSSGGNTVTGGAQSMSATNGGNSVKGGDVNVHMDAPRPAASAPSTVLTSVGTDNCLGSASGSFGNGFISFGGGSTKESVECNRRANGRRLDEMGMHKAAIALQCMNEEVRGAMKLAGTPCPQDEAEAAARLSREEKMSVARALKESGQPNLGQDIIMSYSGSADADPIVCERTGERCGR